MVESNLCLDTIFSSLADATRRDILKRVAKHDLAIGEIARPYNMTFAAVAKHIRVLEQAKLVIKRRQGKEQIVSASPKAISLADTYLTKYKEMLEARFDRLEDLVTK